MGNLKREESFILFLLSVALFTQLGAQLSTIYQMEIASRQGVTMVEPDHNQRELIAEENPNTLSTSTAYSSRSFSTSISGILSTTTSTTTVPEYYA
ncbi:hypothetical protein COU14_02000 [Candidatus Kaiserbacteria bacterium CG10_big_fil_rev_8_21_14_0_10_44_10]|uniref:Uncharacterized protein n=1 Tax=Candidatus Kaiserbacteria bacterium CG10_big_fil_rev_8_21_14_0_10_44_10 TaxID=1974606 RepID=A0A2H0UHJ9_9BACT|nr:MAG: hypothetical protein COU14_02000 [Candidatus Kaiserbacteria bacterium CG10_big_fil_rev_8_21_14_0_10_44_10]